MRCLYLILEAPTGFGKSPVGVALALTLGSSYVCTSTKELQTQYSRDFPYVKVAKGKNNFPCLVKEDFIENGTYRCGACVSNNATECYHTTVEYGPCITDESFKDSGCKYRTFLKDYRLSNKGTKNENVFIDVDSKRYYQNGYSGWLHLSNIKERRSEWKPCEYFDQLNAALTSSHSIFNYSIFFGLLPNKKFLPPRNLLVVDEGHLLETDIIKYRGLSISKRRWKRYIPNLKIVDYGYDDIEKWIDFLIEIETRVLNLTGNKWMVELLSVSRRLKYNWTSKNSRSDDSNDNNKRIISASELFETDKEIAAKYEENFSIRSSNIGDELAVEVKRDLEKLTRAINNILSNPKNWIVSEIKEKITRC